MGPEESMQIQSNLGSTIAMAFDECPSSKADRPYVQNSVDRTTRWLVRCQKKMRELNGLEGTINPSQLLFGINQGAIFDDIRIEHAKRIAELDLDGYAVGGLAVWETHDEMYHILEETVPYLPENKPVYLMGVGTPANILEAVERGVDFFDCVYPSRNGRHGHLYTNFGKINLFNQKYEKDMRPIEEGCGCPACRRYSRAYIRHLLKAKEMLGMRLCVLHNLYFYNTMMTEIRDALDEGRFAAYKKEKLERMKQGQARSEVLSPPPTILRRIYWIFPIKSGLINPGAMVEEIITNKIGRPITMPTTKHSSRTASIYLSPLPFYYGQHLEASGKIAANTALCSK